MKSRKRAAEQPKRMTLGLNIKTNHKIVELREMRKTAFKINSYCDEKPAQRRSYTIGIVINTPKSKVVVQRCCDNSAAPFFMRI